MISVNHGICQGFPQCDFNVAYTFWNNAALSEQEHEPVHEGRNRSQFAWQGVLQSDMRAPVIMGCPHSENFLTTEIGSL
jgi:hypothetical protein